MTNWSNLRVKLKDVHFGGCAKFPRGPDVFQPNKGRLCFTNLDCDVLVITSLPINHTFHGIQTLTLWPQQTETMEYSGHDGHSWMTSTLLTTWHSFHTSVIRSKTTLTVWQHYQQAQRLRSTRKKNLKKQKSWKITSTLKSIYMEGQSKKLILSGQELMQI